MLRVDNWLDIAPLENMENDHSFLFLKRNLMKIFFFWIWKTWIFRRNWKFWIFFFEKFGNLEFFQGIENFDWWFFFFFFWKQPKKYEPNAPSPKAFFENFLLFFFFFFFERFRKNYYYYYLKYEDLFIIKKWRRWRWRWSKSDEDLFMMIVFLKNISFE